MGKVFIWMLVASSSIFISTCWVRRFIWGLLWLCMHMIDVSAGSMY